MKKVRLQEYTIHAEETIICLYCEKIIADYGERIYKSGYWKKDDLTFCSITCATVGMTIYE